MIIDADGSAHITDDTGECWCNPSIITVEAKEPGMISDEAVEAAAKAIHDEFCREDWHLGQEIGQACYDFKHEANVVLEAAAPYIKAEAWDEAAASIIDEHGNPIVPTNVTNPYRSQA